LGGGASIEFPHFITGYDNEENAKMGKTTIFTGKPWEQNVPHAPANISSGRLLHVSGITARLPDGSVAGPGDMRRQAEQILQNIKDVYKAAGADLGRIVRMTIYVTSIEDWRKASDVISELYASRPAATLIEVSRLATPEMVLEIETTAELDG
jgi:2-iminobutanoate/2-iminopropanoate deaminase